MKDTRSQKVLVGEVKARPDRPTKAILICFIIGMLLCGVLFVVDRAESTEQNGDLLANGSSLLLPPGGTYSGAVWEAMTSSCSLVDELEAMGFIVWNSDIESTGKDPIWGSLSEEIANLDAYERCITEPTGTLVCLLSKQQREDAIAQLDEALEARNWLNATADEDTLRTYIKEKGEYRWLLAETLEVEGETSIVLHIQRG